MTGNRHNPPRKTISGVRAIALFEASKGVVALLAGSGLLLLWNSDIQAAGDKLLRHLHLNPGRLHGNVLWKALTTSDGITFKLLAAGVLCYALLRFVEAAGLWLERRWAEWLGVLSGGIYVPLEIRELIRQPGILSVALLLVNILIVGYLALCLKNQGRSEHPGKAP
jgi:uncharacterized membrane protein (DUF2068 family)